MISAKAENYNVQFIELLNNPTQFKKWISHFDYENANWHVIFQILKKGLVFRRVVAIFRDNNVELPHFFYQEDTLEKTRIENALLSIGLLTNYCREDQIPYILTKAFQHYPDMGHDIDLTVMDPKNKLHRKIKDELKIHHLPATVTNTLSNKISFILDNDMPLEIHNGRTGHIGEHETYVKILIQRSLELQIDGQKFQIPSNEDKLVIQVLQRIYGHFSFRLSDIINGLEIMKNRALDFSYVQQVATNMGITAGLRLYLSCINLFLCKNDLQNINEKFVHLMRENKPRLVSGKDGYQIGLLSEILPAYLKKFLNNLLRFNLSTAGRLMFVPLLAINTLYKVYIRNRF